MMLLHVVSLVCCISIFTSHKIFFYFSFTHWLFRNMCNLHIFVSFPVFLIDFYFSFLATPYNLQDLISQTRDVTQVLYNAKTELLPWTTRAFFPLQCILEEAKREFEIHVFVIPWRKPLLDLVSPPIPPPADSSPPFSCALRSWVGMQWRQGCPQLLPR